MADAPPDDSGFLSRWSRRKALVRQGVAPVEPVPAAVAQPVSPTPVPPAPVAAAEPVSAVPEAPPPPTLADVALLTRDSDYTRFVAPGVDTGVKNAALKQLFTDPHFNLMDGLDTYIDDYGIPDPLPAGMLRQMVQSQALGLFADEPPTPDAAADAAPNPTPLAQATPDEDAALRLQPHDAAGPASAGQGPGPDAGRQC
ncbi:DUF3306 domain-containing protein [Pseudaquabacterium pictum]|uniref:DUF3306 domain-containing protein n=1 Tax=Pseudaquabacterium pictum TaxID=2315236 RepID=A0A480AK74_9BURK|nr:DUF3306 domain-containing protein [Rubrivivax pictus]GCL61120.1 hypothetical protein AQPW35_02010 [Rubrivivax pictus]